MQSGSVLLLDSHIVTDWHYVSVLYILLYKECEALYKAHQRHLVSKPAAQVWQNKEEVENFSLSADPLSESVFCFMTINENWWEKSLAEAIKCVSICEDRMYEKYYRKKEKNMKFL